jgi:hypothetical protein
MFDPPTVGSSLNYFYRDGGWYWFGGTPVANFYNRLRVATPVPTPPPVYDNTTGTVVSGTAEPARHWMGDDVTTEDYGSPATPSWALNYGIVDEIKFTFWNWNAAPSNAAGVISADLTFQIFDRADTSAVIGDEVEVTLDFTGDPLDQFYFVTATVFAVEDVFGAYIPLTKPDHQYGIRYRTTAIEWTTHNNIEGEPGQIIRRPEDIGTTDPGIFYLDPLETGEDQYGGEDGWYSFTGGTAAALHYALSVKAWDVCDMNCDGSINAFDIDPFVLALAGGQAAYELSFPTCNWYNADANGDNSVDSFDIDPFVDCLTGK